MKLLFIDKIGICLLLLTGLAGLLSACGQYGDLYLPKDIPAEQTQQQENKAQDKDKPPQQQPAGQPRLQ